MILYADFRTDESRMAAIEATVAEGAFGKAAPTLASPKAPSARSLPPAVWVRAKGRDVSIGLLAKLEKKVPGLRKKISMVVVAEGLEHRIVTWSGVRAAVSFGNTLAFALGVPVCGITIDGDASANEVVEQLRRDCFGPSALATTRQKWVQAHYVGEPNITVPKK